MLINSKPFRSNFIYTTSIFLPSIFGLLITPFFAHTLSKDDVGLLYLLTTQTQALAIFALFGMETYFIRSSFENNSDQHQTKLISILIVAFSAIFFLILALVFLNIDLLARIYGISNKSNVIIYSSFFLIPLESLYGFVLAVLRVKKKYRLLFWTECIRLSIYVIGLYIFMHQLDLDIYGRNLSALASLSLLIFYPIFWIKSRKSFRLDLALTKQVVNFAKYWIPSTFILTFMPLFDRAFILYFLDKKSVASFSIAFSLAGVCRLLGAGLTRYCEPFIFSENPRAITTRSMNLLEVSFVRSITYATSIAIILIPLVYKLVMPSDYHDDLLLCSLIIIAAISTYLNQFSSSRIKALYQSRILLMIHFCSLLLKFTVAVPLISNYGLIGYAIACVLEGVIYFFAYRYFDPHNKMDRNSMVYFETSVVLLSSIYLQSIVETWINLKVVEGISFLFLFVFSILSFYKLIQSLLVLLHMPQTDLRN